MHADEFVHRATRLIDQYRRRRSVAGRRISGTNGVFVRPAAHRRAHLVQEFGAVPEEFLSFVDQVAEVALPDFWDGYFIGPVSWTLSLHRHAAPRAVVLDQTAADVLIFGADGAGTTYALVAQDDSPAYRLPPGKIEDGLYRPAAGHERRFRPVADSFSAFLRRLVSALEAYGPHGGPDPFGADA